MIDFPRQSLIDHMKNSMAERDLAAPPGAIPEERRQQIAERLARLGHWEGDLCTGRIEWSAGAWRIFGLAPREQGLALGELLERIHPEDRGRFSAGLYGGVRAGAPWELEFRLLFPDGEVRYLHGREEVSRDTADRPIRFFGVVQDVTEHKRVEAALRESEELRRTFLDQATDGFFVHDATGLVLDVNQRACELLGYAREELVGHGPEKYDPDLTPERLARVLAALDAGESLSFETRHQRKDGDVFSVEVHIRAFWREGRRYAVSLSHDITERKQAEAALCASEREFRTLAEHTPDCIVRWDRDLQRMYVNPAFAAAMGTTPEVLTGGRLGHYPDQVPAEDPPYVQTLRAAVERVFATGEPAEQLLPWRTFGREILFHLRLVPECDGTGNPVTVLGIGRDVTALKRAEDELRSLTENSPDFIARVDRAHRYLYVNRVVERFTGRPPEAHLGRRLGEIFSQTHPGRSRPELAGLQAAIDQVFATGRPVDQEATANLPDGEIVLEGRLVPEFASDGTVATVLVIARDATARRRAEAALRANEARLRAFLDQATDGVFVHAADGTLIDVNRRACEMLGYDREELLGCSPLTFDPDLTPEKIAWIVGRLESGEPVCHETRHRRKDGSVYPVEVHSRALWHEGRRYGISLAHDISERKRAEAALRASEQAYAGLVNTIDGIVWEADATTFRFTFVSQQAERILGHPVARWLEKADFWERHLHPDDRARAMAYCLEQTRAGHDHEFDYRMIAADGHIVWLHDRVTFVPAEGGQPARLRGLMVDFTARKQVEQALGESEHRFRQVVEAIDEIFWLDDAATGAVIYESPAYERIWGRPGASLQAAPRSWLDAVHPNDRARVTALVDQRAVAGYDTEYRIIRPDGVIRHIHEKVFPVRDAHGRVTRIAGVAEDITARCELADQLRQSQKMEAIGRLAGGVAHDFNNLLTAIQLQTELLQTEPSADPVWVEGLANIQEVSRRATALTRQLLTFSRCQAKQARPLALPPVLDGLKRLIQPLLGENVRLVRQASLDLPDVHADPGMLEQVVMNLLVNARDALPEAGGEISVALNAVEIGAAAARLPARAGRFVCLSVADTGCGIPPENLVRIFEPFYTTKGPDKGTGLGLATAYGIVQEHEGWIEVESQVGRGTVFRVFLPALARSAKPVGRPAAALPLSRGNETVLVAEDQPEVRLATQALLRRLGYQVSVAASGAEALRVWAEMGGRCDLLMTDLGLPGGMSGQQLAAELCRYHPTLRVIYTSGYRSPTQTGSEPLEPGRNFLPKPYLLQGLAEIVRRKLDEARPAPKEPGPVDLC